MQKIFDLICDHLVERTATLFLGAGVNAGIKNAKGDTFPLGDELANWICRDLLESPETVVPLDEAVEMAQRRLGPEAVNKYLFEQFERFRPGAAHLALVQLPWDTVYTTNFDLLVEQAAAQRSITPAGQFRTVLSATTSLTKFTEEDILYYKLHGSVDLANTPDGHLILTKDDYRRYEEYKKPLFRRLRTDLVARTFLFVGYRLSDPNFRAILDDCRSELGTESLPLSYAVQWDFSKVQETFWRDKYNVQLVKCDATEFLSQLKETWTAQECKVVPFLDRKAVEYLHLDQKTRFQKVGDSFFLLRPSDCTGPANPRMFFRGAEPTWADIREKVAPHRDLYDSILEVIFPDLVDPTVEPSAILISGSAGTGKTTLARQLAFDVASDFQAPVLIHVAGTPLDVRVFTPYIKREAPQRFLIVVHYAAEYLKELSLFWEELRHRKLPVTLILEERTNQWLVAKESIQTQFAPTEFVLGSLSANEKEGILNALEKFECLDKLTSMSPEERMNHFEALAHDDLLVALRELTTDTRFDLIVKDEFEKIPSELAKQAYVFVAAVSQLDLSIRYETIIRILKLRWDQLRPNILLPTEGVLISGEETGASRHNIGFRLQARHPIIASVIWSLAAPTDDKKFETLNVLLSNLDVGLPEDQRLVSQIIRTKKLVNTFAEFAMRRALFERISVLLPNDPYVYQHRSIIEREMRDAEQAVNFARLAVKHNPKNAAFQNTLGLALELQARDVEDNLKRQALLQEASKLFEDGIRRDVRDPFGHIGMLNVRRQRLEREKNPEKRAEILFGILALLEEAFEATNESPIIAGELSKIREQIGSLDEAIKLVRGAVKRDPKNVRLLQLLTHFEMEKGDLKEALGVAIQAAKIDPTSWRIQRVLARLRRQLGESMQTVSGHYEAAIRHQKADVALAVEYSAYLFTQGNYKEAAVQFEHLKNLTMSAKERQRVREIWRDSNRKPRIFEGKVNHIAGVKGIIVAIPENFESFFWRTTATSLLREGDDVRFEVGFNTQGAVARHVRHLR